MNRPLLLLTLLSLSAVLASPVPAKAREAPYWYPAPAEDAYGAGASTGFVDSYGTRYLPLDSMAPSATGGDWWVDPYTGERPLGAAVDAYAPARISGPGLYEAFAREPQPFRQPPAPPAAGWPGQGEPWERSLEAYSYPQTKGPKYPGQVQGPPRRDLSPFEPAEYRFRGDDRFGDSWGAPYREGWRFRPLTEQERDRARPNDPWRPVRPATRGEIPSVGRFGEGPAGAQEAFGYEPDNWFHRYYGERP
jgi:hypothetical protein